MATQADLPSDAGRTRKKSKPVSPFGGGIPIAVIGLVATVIGFLPTFFLKQNKVDTIHLVHGWTMTGWIVLVLMQALLIRSRKYAYHRALGWFSLVLFVSMVMTSLMVIALMLSGKSGLPFEAAKFFGYSDIIDFPLLMLSFCGAIYWRRDRHLHSRLMAVTVLTSIVPALARMFNILIWRSFEGLYYAMHPTYLLILGALGWAALADWKAGKLRWPLPLAFGWFIVVYATNWPMMSAGWYNDMTHWIGSLA